jgi:hypothetical protein
VPYHWLALRFFCTLVEQESNLFSDNLTVSCFRCAYGDVYFLLPNSFPFVVLCVGRNNAHGLFIYNVKVSELDV